MLEEICLNHVIGWSKRKKSEIDKKDLQHQYCPGCVRNEENKQCPYYHPIKLHILKVISNDGYL